VLEPAPSLGDNTPETRVTRCYMVVVSTLDFFEFFETQTVFFGSGGQRHVVRLAKEGSVGITVVCGIRVYEETHGIYPHSARFASGNIHTVDHRGGDVDVHETLDALVFPTLGSTDPLERSCEDQFGFILEGQIKIFIEFLVGWRDVFMFKQRYLRDLLGVLYCRVVAEFTLNTEALLLLQAAVDGFLVDRRCDYFLTTFF